MRDPGRPSVAASGEGVYALRPADDARPEAASPVTMQLTQLQAVTMAMDDADHRGLAGDPQAFLDGLPWGWALVDTNAVGQLAGTLMDALIGPWDELPATAMVQDERDA